MYLVDFHNLRAGDLVWLAPKPERPATAEAFAELREFFGPETIDPDAFEVQTDAGIWSREGRPGSTFLTWAQLEET